MTTPYDTLFSTPETVLFYAAVTLFLAAWAFVSVRYSIRWVIEFHAGMSRWRGDGLPDKKATNELALIMIVWSVNLFLLGAFLHVAL